MLGWAVVRVDGGDGPARAGRRNGMSHAHGNERLDLASVPNASSACAENEHQDRGLIAAPIPFASLAPSQGPPTELIPAEPPTDRHPDTPREPRSLSVGLRHHVRFMRH